MTGLQVINDLRITATPLKITWPKVEVQTAIDNLLGKYKGVVVRAEDVKDSKADMAALNKIAKALGDGRKSMSKEILAPLKTVEDDIKNMER